jgi:pimeloyl-ACP methyl ester carboxylesterase/class 3 adenylate cyclase
LSQSGDLAVAWSSEAASSLAAVDSPTVKYARTGDGVHIAYQTWGSGPVDILLSGALWWHIEFQWSEPTLAHVFEALGRIGRVIAFDKRGTGLSDRVPTDRLPTLEERTDDLTAVLDALGVERAVVVGQNHGAPMALLFAATYPERTHSLVLQGGFARFVRAADYPWGFPEQLAERTLARMEEHWDEPNALAQVAPGHVDDAHAREWWARMQRMAVSPAAAVALFRMSMETDVRDVLAAIHVPTLVVHLKGDRLINVGCGRHLAEHIEGARFVEAEGSDIVFEESPEIWDAIHEFVTGRPSIREPDRVLATVVFTDIVDSTKHLTALGDSRWREMLDRHDALVDRSVERYRGRKVNPTGDGMLAVFDGPARAVQCACAIRDGVEALGIEVRAGVHTGEVEVRGDDVAGVAVHIGARVASMGNAGDILVTRTVTDLVAGSGLEFADRGEHDLKGLPGTWQIYAVDSA